MNAARTAYRYLTVILAADVVVQFFLAGAGVFRADGGKASDSSAFDPHRANGTAFQILALLLFIAAAVGQRNRRNLAGLLFGLSVVQGFLAISGWAGGLHPVVGLGLAGLVGWLAHDAWRGRTAAADAGARTPR